MRILIIFFGLFLSLFILSCTQTANDPSLLEGRTFVGDINERGSGVWDVNDVLVFKDGKFSTKACERWGFKPTSYQAVEKDGVINFQAVMESKDKGTINWVGKVKENNLEAAFNWHRKDQKSLGFWIKAEEENKS